MTAQSGAGKLTGRHAIVTGGSAGIGEAVARLFAREGCQVAIAGRQLAECERVATDIRRSGGMALAVRADVTVAAEVERLVAETLNHLGAVDILVNAVGGFHSRANLGDIAEADWDAVMDLNLKSAFLCARAVSRPMIAQQAGRIVNFATPTAIHPSAAAPSNLPYACAKAGVIALTKHLASQLGPHGITVNTVTPGTTLTPRVDRLWDQKTKDLKAATNALRRLPEPGDSANAVLYLVAEESRNVTGINIHVNAGQVFY